MTDHKKRVEDLEKEIQESSIDMVTLRLPRHAVRFLGQMCKLHRKGLATLLIDNMPSVQSEAAFDSLNCIESVIPDSIWKEIELRPS
jgi:hypothetical protein